MIYEDKVLTKEHIKVEEGDYICADDHLLYCGRCRTPKQVRIQLNGQPKIMNCLCQCGTEKRDAEEEAWKRRDRMNRIKRLRVEGLQIPLGRTYTFSHDDGSNPKMEFARSYVKSWNTCREKNLGLFLTGGVGSGKLDPSKPRKSKRRASATDRQRLRDSRVCGGSWALPVK